MTYHCWSALTDPALHRELVLPGAVGRRLRDLVEARLARQLAPQHDGGARHRRVAGQAAGDHDLPPGRRGIGRGGDRQAAGRARRAARGRACSRSSDGQQVSRAAVVVGQQGTSVARGAARGFVVRAPVDRERAARLGCCCGQKMWGSARRRAAPAGLSRAATHSSAARKRSDDGTIRRRIAETPAAVHTRICEA